MHQAIQTAAFSKEVSTFDWELTLDRIICETEAAEFDLALQCESQQDDQRKSSGSYYTPADVADHVWDLFFRFNKVETKDDFLGLILSTKFVEPSCGSGIFVFTFIRKALKFGLAIEDIAKIRFLAIDINLAALRFLRLKLIEIETIWDIDFLNIVLTQSDFLEWAPAAQLEKVAIVGNPPFVKNPLGSKWKNLYGDFLEAVLDLSATEKATCLIVPMSICFSRDYVDLRNMISTAKCGISASSYDNIPDSLFKAGKPESKNTNKANSQRCTILNLGGPNSAIREAAPLRRWYGKDRYKVLTSTPEFKDYSDYSFDSQIPRPTEKWILPYLSSYSGLKTRCFMLKGSPVSFSIAGVGRNYIGIRDPNAPNAYQVKAASESDALILLQIFGSDLFFEYWRSVGDGFHVTSDIIERFPISPSVMDHCLAKNQFAKQVWENRHLDKQEKLNSGQLVVSYDFRRHFTYLRPTLDGNSCL
jgi:hypothetical protein